MHGNPKNYKAKKIKIKSINKKLINKFDRNEVYIPCHLPLNPVHE